MCPCLWLRLLIGKRSGWNIGIAALGWEDACFSMLCMSPFLPQPQSMPPWQISPSVRIIFSSAWRAFAHPGPHSDPTLAHIYNLLTPYDTHNQLCIHSLTQGCHVSSRCTPSIHIYSIVHCTLYIIRLELNVTLNGLVEQCLPTFKCSDNNPGSDEWIPTYCQSNLKYFS